MRLLQTVTRTTTQLNSHYSVTQRRSSTQQAVGLTKGQEWKKSTPQARWNGYQKPKESAASEKPKEVKALPTKPTHEIKTPDQKTKITPKSDKNTDLIVVHRTKSGRLVKPPNRYICQCQKARLGCTDLCGCGDGDDECRNTYNEGSFDEDDDDEDEDDDDEDLR
ncbi:hypothetical protein AC249_AIPGENE14183 [Exaiptasia diaphana]|nr:hypothetical protein AC249_AIPGENE14183 [Exaiptasia diaphana]